MDDRVEEADDGPPSADDDLNGKMSDGSDESMDDDDRE